MNREPLETSLLGPSGDGVKRAPALRETPTAGPETEPAAWDSLSGAPWSAFVARILRPAAAPTANDP